MSRKICFKAISILNEHTYTQKAAQAHNETYQSHRQTIKQEINEYNNVNKRFERVTVAH